MRMPDGVDHGFLRDAQEVMLKFGGGTGGGDSAVEGTGDAARDRRPLGELPQGELEAADLALVRFQREDRAARLGKAVARLGADAAENIRQRRPARAAHVLFGGAELHEDAGEALGKSVVDLLADPVALREDGGVLGRNAESLQRDGERRLLRQRDQQLDALGRQRVPMAE